METLADIRQRWYLYLVPFVIWAFAYVRVFVDPTPRLPLLFNWTPSLPYKVAWLTRNPSQLARGDFVVYRFEGEAGSFYPGLARQPFFKIVGGLPGEVVAVDGQDVYVNGEWMGTAKSQAFDGRPLLSISPTVIPPAHFYAQGLAADSFDSRYASSGLVRFDQVIGTVVPLL
jgi:conjugal transfer pilin signal peptidase TrbI